MFLFLPWDAFGGGYILLKRDIRVFTAKEGPSIILLRAIAEDLPHRNAKYIMAGTLSELVFRTYL